MGCVVLRRGLWCWCGGLVVVGKQVPALVAERMI